jgi:predicted RNA-binding Zn-ribbon protein involved in translation (DUF1610 family)
VAIILVTLFLGWTILGWIGALVWAIVASKEERYIYVCKKCGFQGGFQHELKMYKCPQCGEENYI